METAKLHLMPRSPWQAVDLGTQMYRHWCWPVTRVWLLTTLLPFLLLLALAYAQQTLWPFLLFWWLKPLWERPLLAFYSEAVFAQTPSALSLLRRWPGYARHGLLAQLSWARLAPSRSFITPILQLEGNPAAQIRRRKQALRRPPSSGAGRLTLLVFHIEQGLVLGLLTLLYLLIPWQLHIEFSDWFLNHNPLLTTAIALCWYLAMTLCQPLYVACGFALYLNKRTWLEGWDLQLAFSRIAQRRTAISTTVLLLAGLTLLLPATEVHADNNLAAKQEAVSLLAEPTYMPLEIQQRRHLIERDNQADTPLGRFWDWLFERFDSPADRRQQSWSGPADWLVWTLAWSLLFLAVIWLFRQWQRRPASTSHAGAAQVPLSLAGLDLRQQQLPDDLPAAVRQALQQGDRRLALSLLMRTSLARLLQHFPQPLPAGCTEQQCLRLLEQHYGQPAALLFLERLTQQWIATAWAHRPPAEEQILALLQDWQGLVARLGKPGP